MCGTEISTLAKIFLMLIDSKKYLFHNKGLMKPDFLTKRLNDHSSVGHNLPSKDIFPWQDGDKRECDYYIFLSKSGKSLGSDKLISPVGLDSKKGEK